MLNLIKVCSIGWYLSLFMDTREDRQMDFKIHFFIITLTFISYECGEKWNDYM